MRLAGDLPTTEEVSALLGIAPTTARRRGEGLAGGLGVQREDVWLLRLGILEDGDREIEERAEEAGRMADALRRMAPALVTLDRTRCRVELYVGAVEKAAKNEHETYAGGFLLPEAVVSAAAECGLELRVSTLTMIEGER